MGKRIENKMKKRFGDPMRITVSFPKKPMSSSELTIHNKGLASAYIGLLESLLGRKPTQDEIYGRVSLEKFEEAIKNRKPLKPMDSFDWMI